jgi:hypothetical protein
MKRTYGELKRRVQSGEELRRTIERHPLASIGVAAAAGMLVAKLVTGSRKEAPRAQNAESNGHSAPPQSSFWSTMLSPIVKGMQDTAMAAVENLVMGAISQWMTRAPSKSADRSSPPPSTPMDRPETT